MAGCAAALVVGLRLAAGEIGAPIGEDAAFWGARGVDLASGRLAGEHPPLYPLLAATLAALSGTTVGRAAEGLSFVATVMLPPAMAALGARLGGRAAGRWTGWLTLGLPTLLAWGMRVEPTSLLALAVVGAAIATVDVAAPAEPPSGAWRRGAPFGVGLACAALASLKETGAPIGLALVAVLTLARWRAGRRDEAMAAVLGGLVGSGAIVLVTALTAGNGGVGGRVHQPLGDTLRMLREGRRLQALGTHDVPGWIVPGALRATLGPQGAPPSRTVAFVAVQALRTAAMAGPWLVGLALVRPRAAWAPALPDAPRGLLSAALPLALLAGALPLAPVVFQSRHLEVPLLGVVLALGLALGARVERGAPRWLPVAALAVALAWTGLRFGLVELPRATNAVGCAREEDTALAAALSRLPDGAALCSDEAWVRFRLDRPAPVCVDAPDAWELRPRRLPPRPGERPRAVPVDATALGRGTCKGELVLVPPR